mmetsp:Transcript_39805/g.66179  ORF Transcript_39805/g.66179 Transcript_39805/m.66179 type:complete len:105 (-) Transcript_39805:45-359(-)
MSSVAINPQALQHGNPVGQGGRHWHAQSRIVHEHNGAATHGSGWSGRKRWRPGDARCGTPNTGWLADRAFYRDRKQGGNEAEDKNLASVKPSSVIAGYLMAVGG